MTASRLDTAINSTIAAIGIAASEAATAHRAGLNASVIEWREGYLRGLEHGLLLLEELSRHEKKTKRRLAG